MWIGIILLVGVLAAPNASAEDRPDVVAMPLLSGVSDDELDVQRGGDAVPVAVPVSEATLNATLEQNTILSDMTGSNFVGGDAFTGASGFFTVIQNSGNGVIIQDSTIINLSLE